MQSNSEKTSKTNGIVSGFQFGIIFGIGILTLIQIIRLSTVVKDDKNLESYITRSKMKG